MRHRNRERRPESPLSYIAGHLIRRKQDISRQFTLEIAERCWSASARISCTPLFIRSLQIGFIGLSLSALRALAQRQTKRKENTWCGYQRRQEVTLAVTGSKLTNRHNLRQALRTCKGPTRSNCSARPRAWGRTALGSRPPRHPAVWAHRHRHAIVTCDRWTGCDQF